MCRCVNKHHKDIIRTDIADKKVVNKHHKDIILTSIVDTRIVNKHHKDIILTSIAYTRIVNKHHKDMVYDRAPLDNQTNYRSSDQTNAQQWHTNELRSKRKKTTGTGKVVEKRSRHIQGERI